MNSLEKAHKNAISHMDREHVTLFYKIESRFYLQELLSF